MIPDQEPLAQPGRDRAVDEASLSRLSQRLQEVGRSAGVPLDAPIRELNPDQLNFVLDAVRTSSTISKPRNTNCTSGSSSAGTVATPCVRTADGSRLRQEARNIYIAGKNIADVCRMTIRESAEFFSDRETDTAPSRKSPNASSGRSGRGCDS